MHYYKFNIGDYASHTRHLSPIEDITYRRLLDLAYTSEQPITNDIHNLSRLINLREYQTEIKDVLNEFFEHVIEGWIHGRVLKELEDAGVKSEKAKQSALVRWQNKKDANAMRQLCERNANALESDAKCKENDATHNTRPITQDPLPKSKSKNTSIPKDFGISDQVKLWAEKNGHSKLEERLNHFVLCCEAKNYQYANWDSAFRKAISDDWAKLGKPESKALNKPFDLNEWMKDK